MYCIYKVRYNIFCLLIDCSRILEDIEDLFLCSFKNNKNKVLVEKRLIFFVIRFELLLLICLFF